MNKETTLFLLVTVSCRTQYIMNCMSDNDVNIVLITDYFRMSDKTRAMMLLLKF